MEIRFLSLHTAALRKTADFYRSTLKLPCITFGETYAIFQAGSTQLMFEKTETKDEGQPYYHFAFEIPRNQLKSARAWLEANNIELLRRGGEVEVQFPDWNACSLYFYDPSGNIVELIARQNLDNDSDQEFSSEQILRISEIGWPVWSIEHPDRDFQLPAWRDYGTMKALGAETGLILLVEFSRPWLPTDKAAAPFACKLVIADETGSRFYYRF